MTRYRQRLTERAVRCCPSSTTRPNQPRRYISTPPFASDTPKPVSLSAPVHDRPPLTRLAHPSSSCFPCSPGPVSISFARSHRNPALTLSTTHAPRVDRGFEPCSRVSPSVPLSRPAPSSSPAPKPLALSSLRSPVTRTSSPPSSVCPVRIQEEGPNLTRLYFAPARSRRKDGRGPYRH